MTPLKPILAANRIRQVDALLLELLATLAPDDWDRETIVPGWRVRDIAGHLLDTATRKLSLVRDQCFVESVRIESRQDLADLVNRLNREGVAVYRRLSPRVLVAMLEAICPQFAVFHESLDPLAPAAFAVSWAGEGASPNWFDTARELTERWHHQQQIRLAVGREGMLTPELYHPVLDCFLRALPFHFRNVQAAEGTRLHVRVDGLCGGLWWLERTDGGWTLGEGAAVACDAAITIPEGIAWRIFTRGIRWDEARALCTVEGDSRIAEHVLTLTSIVA